MPKYFPEPPPEPKLPEFRALGEYVFRELNRISQSIFTDVYLNLEETFVAPEKPQNGDVVYADGTSWNPGNGQGVYAYIDGTWIKLGIGILDDLTLDDLFADDISADDITFTGNLVGEFNVPDSLVVNGAMQISQENGNTAGAGANYYPADEWRLIFVTSAGVVSAQRVQVATPNGSNDRIRLSVTTADVSLAAGEYLGFQHAIEGNRVAHLQWGTANAKQVIVRFGFKGPAGTYSVNLINSGGSRSYVREFTISAGQANTDTEQVFVFPGDTSGTWLKDSGQGLSIRFTLAAGTTFHTTANAWQAGNFLGTTATSNGLGVNTNVFEVFDVGLYVDVDVAGIPPKWTAPDYIGELYKCMRYWEQDTSGSAKFFDGNVTSGTGYNNPVTFQVEKRVTPTMTGVNEAVSAFPATVGSFTPTIRGFFEGRTANATAKGVFRTSWTANARL